MVEYQPIQTYCGIIAEECKPSEEGKDIKMAKSILQKYLSKPTSVYHIVDKEFISRFSTTHGTFMLMYYYKFYCSFCNENKIKILPMNTFLLNARRRRIKLIQVCCPFCGNMDLMIWDKPYSDFKSKYCSYCGKCSTAENIFLQISALIRMQQVHMAGYNALKNDYNESDLEIISYDIWHMELVELTCILEATLRDFYINLIYLKYKNYESSYIDDVIIRSTNNDFMNIEKANKHYKTGLDVNLKELISEDCWKSLIDLAQIRNTIIHNNGMVDDKFEKSPSFTHIKDNVEGKLIFVNTNMINNYLLCVLELFAKIEEVFDKLYKEELPSLIANYYFNLHLDLDFS